jgi:hypothetical protein
VTAGQLAFDLALPQAPEPAPAARTYWENRGPNQWEPVTVRTRYAVPGTPPAVPFPHLNLGQTAPRNVLVERADGSRDVRPVRLLRTKQPRCVPAQRPRSRDLRGQRITSIRKHRIVDVQLVGNYL